MLGKKDQGQTDTKVRQAQQPWGAIKNWTILTAFEWSPMEDYSPRDKERRLALHLGSQQTSNSMCFLCKNIQHEPWLYKYRIGDSEVRLSSATISYPKTMADGCIHYAAWDPAWNPSPDLPKQDTSQVKLQLQEQLNYCGEKPRT